MAWAVSGIRPQHPARVINVQLFLIYYVIKSHTVIIMEQHVLILAPVQMFHLIIKQHAIKCMTVNSIQAILVLIFHVLNIVAILQHALIIGCVYILIVNVFRQLHVLNIINKLVQ